MTMLRITFATLMVQKFKFFNSIKLIDICLKDENLDKAQYVDLIINPERFTGYQGPHAHKIWNSSIDGPQISGWLRTPLCRYIEHK